MNKFDDSEFDDVILYDRVIVLENDIRLLTKVSDKYFNSGIIVLLHPYIVSYNHENSSLLLQEWIPESASPIYYIQISKVVTVALPSGQVLEYYNDMLKGNKEQDIKSNSILH